MPQDNKKPDRNALGFASEVRGRRAETWAVVLLTCKGYRILGRRVKTHAGEIDLIARAPSGVTCFVEVKARPDHDAGLQSIRYEQQGRVARAAELYLSSRPALRTKGVRFDAVVVVPKAWPRHVKNAWQP